MESNEENDLKLEQQSILQSGSSLRTLKNWVAKTPAERTRENLELANLDNELAGTIAGLSPQTQAEVKLLSDSNRSVEAEQMVIAEVVSDDRSTKLRREARRGSIRDELRLHDRIYWIATGLAMIALYFIFSWLSSGHIQPAK